MMFSSQSHTDCFANVHQEFLVSTTIHKARHLLAFNSNTYVRVSLDKATKKTKVFPNSENPYYNEYFIFELSCTLPQLLRLTILYEVKKKSTCLKDVVIGELLVDMHSVWNQTNRCFFKKWGRLENSIKNIASNEISSEDGNGYLQIDLAIISQAHSINSPRLETSATGFSIISLLQSPGDFDDIEKNLLQNADESAPAQCNIKYTMTFYNGFFVRKSNFMIQVSFAGSNGKTQISKTTHYPEWNEEITFSWIYPSLAQIFLIQVITNEHCQWKSIAEYELHFDEISFKDIPCLGPTFVHFYDSLNPNAYVGRILIELKSEILETSITRSITHNNVGSFDEKNWWGEEPFIFELLILQGDFIRKNVSNMKIKMRFGEHSSNQLECFTTGYTNIGKAGKDLKYFYQAGPPFKAISLEAKLPDNRSKYEGDIFIMELRDFLKHELEAYKLFELKYTNDFQLHAKCLKAIILSTLSKLSEGRDGKRLKYNGFRQQTPWDKNRVLFLDDYFDKFSDELKDLRVELKSPRKADTDLAIESVQKKLREIVKKLSTLLATTRTQDEWPELQLVAEIHRGSKDVGICKLDAKSFFYSQRPEITGSYCGKERTFIFKNRHCTHSCKHCGCLFGFVQGWLRIATESERYDLVSSSPSANDWKQTEDFYYASNQENLSLKRFKCRLYIHQAKIRPGSDNTGLCDPKVRVMFAGKCAETATINHTLSPIWNCVVNFGAVETIGHMQRYLENPPMAGIELYDVDSKTKSEYIGCGLCDLSVFAQTGGGDKKRADDDDDDEHDQVANEENCEMAEEAAKKKKQKIIKTKAALKKLNALKLLSPPPLKWIPISSEGGVRAEILMSGELIEVAEGEGAVPNESVEVSIGIPKAIRPVMRNFVLEVVFAGLRNYTKCQTSCRMAGRRRIKIMMGDLMLQSGPCTSRLRNSVNFLELYASGVVSLPEQLEYWPAIIATDVSFSCCTKDTTVGAILIPDTKRYFQKNRKKICTPDATASTPAPPPESGEEGDFTVVEMSDEETSSLLKRKKLKWKWLKTPWNKMRWNWKKFTKKMKKSPKRKSTEMTDLHDERDFNWWTKFYNSMYSNHSHVSRKHQLVIYSIELERLPEFSYLTDWAEPFQLVHGLRRKHNALPKENTYATLKLQIRMTACQCGAFGDTLRPLASALNPKLQEQLNSLAELCRVVVRVYVIQGLQLCSRDVNSQSDAYVTLQFGSYLVSDRAHYVPNQSNPIFGKRFQMEGIIPREHVLEITVIDRGLIADKIIGKTYIDIEDRFRSKHRATIGISQEYSRTGYNQWHDSLSPYEVLLDLCSRNDVPTPKFTDNHVEVDGVSFYDETELALDEDLQERLSVTALHNFDQIPAFGYKLVPEHVETRSLYHPDCPGIEQGKLQLWIEVYEGNYNIPPPIDITPIPPQKYELRVIVYDCSGVALNDTNIFGKGMSDIYVMGWCEDSEEPQMTDVHYRSLNGQGNFNWRMIFPLLYSDVEDMMIIKRTGGILEQQDIKQPPMLYLQIWDNDTVSTDDFIGSLELSLSHLPEPFNTAKQCTLPPDDTKMKKSALPPLLGKQAKRRKINLFRQKVVRGWFPCRGKIDPDAKKKKSPSVGIAGKIDLELELLTADEAAAKPVGLGRNPPNALPEPNRPDSSFNPWTNPVKAVTEILGPVLKKCLIYSIAFIIGLFLIVMFIQGIPMKIIGALF